MSNLGAYQWIVETAKKVGGPKNLLLLFGIGTAALGVGGDETVRAIIKKNKRNANRKEDSKEYCIKEKSSYNGVVSFEKGDKFTVLSEDGEAVLINKINDPKSPFIIEKGFLHTISNY